MENKYAMPPICRIGRVKTFLFLCKKFPKEQRRMNLPDFHFALPITDPTWIFFLVLVIILFAPILLERLHIPHIIGMILAGVVVGEHGFNILARDSSFEMFGKVGLYYIMFLAGLEMNMEDFKSIRTKAVVLGLLAFVIPLGIGIWVNMEILDYALITSILLASMYASHTLIAYPIVTRYGINRQRAVGIAVGGTAVTDTLTLLVLAVIAGMYRGETSEMFWIGLVLKVILLSLFILYTFPRIARWFFRQYSDNVVQYIFVMAMVFLGAGLMEFIGMEGILGAFLVGLVLNRLIPHVSPLMNHLEFVGNALFIPYFLISVGMIINLKVLFGHIDSITVACVMIAVALLGKWIASWLTQKIFKMKPVERQLMFGLSNAQAAATLAAVLVGYGILLPDGSRLLNEDVLNGTIMLILVTCIVSSFTTEHAAKRMVMDDNMDLSKEKGNEREKLLIPLVNPHTLNNLMELALVVRNEKQPDNLVALNVMNDTSDSVAQEVRGKQLLERAAQITAATDVRLTTVSRFDLNIATGIIHTAKEHDATDIIIGLHHKTYLVDSFFGKLTENLLKGIHKEVMIAKFLMPVNTLRRINIAVPPKAEYETGFLKWVGQFCRMGSILNCRVHFFANKQTLNILRQVVRKKFASTPTEFTLLDEWDDLLLLTGQVNYDHLLVIVSARRGFISYNPSFERLPSQLSRYFANNSLIVLYPEQLGESQEFVSFADPRGYQESQYYEKVGKWFYKWFKKS